MCGLVGVAGDINKKEKEAFRMLLHLDIIRGPHSTGVAAVDSSGNFEVVKRKGNAWDLFDSSNYSKLINKSSYALIGHNRYATKGKINNINAHPFEFENVVGAHNGTIRGQHRLPDHQDFEVDSENIFYSIQNEGLEDTLAKLDGAYALTYWDNRSNEIVLLRNNERELSFCFTEDMKTIFWASEKWMLQVALDRAGIKHKAIVNLTPCRIYRFNFERVAYPKREIVLVIDEFEEFVPSYKVFPRNTGVSQKKKEGGKGEENKKALTSSGLRVDPQGLVHKRVDFVVEAHGTNNLGSTYIDGSLLCCDELPIRIYFHKDIQSLFHDIVAVHEDTIFSAMVVSYVNNCLYASPASVEEVIDDDEGEEEEDLYPGFDKSLLTSQQWLSKTTRGCAWCASPAMIEDAENIVWLDSDNFVCSDCKSNDNVKEYLLEN